MSHFILLTTTKDLVFFPRFLSMWFGRNTKISDISPEEFERVCRLCMKVPKGGIIAEGKNAKTDR